MPNTNAEPPRRRRKFLRQTSHAICISHSRDEETFEQGEQRRRILRENNANRRREVSNLHIEELDGNLMMLFNNALSNLKYITCSLCQRIELKENFNEGSICSKCKRNPLKFTAENNMMPCIVPDCLKDLTQIEQMLIAIIQPVLRVYQVKACGRPGQFRYRGNIVNVEQDIQQIATELPHTPSNLKVLVIRRQGVNGHRDFRVRRSKVYEALVWLIRNNRWYKNIRMNDSNLQSLPEDDYITNDVTAIHEDGISNEDVSEDQINETGLPMTNHERQRTAVLRTLNWPQALPIPVNEFRTVGYIPMSFPHLFPDGGCDYLDHSRRFKLTFIEWSEYLIRYVDRRFAQDPRFRFFCLNTMQRHNVCNQGAVFAKKNDFDGNIGDLRSRIQTDPSIVKKLLFWGSKIRGSNPYWYQRRQELEMMINSLGVPTLFLTLSAADLWWPCLKRHFNMNEEEQNSLSEVAISRKMQKLLTNNPMIADEYFLKRVEEFMKVLKKKYKIKDFWYRFEYQHRGSPHIHGVFWLADAPDVRLFDSMNETGIQMAKEYYNKLVSAFNPNEKFPPAIKHPSSLSASEIDFNNEDQLAQLLNRVQRHTQHGAYCLRQTRDGERCRFNFPADISESKLQRNEKGYWTYTPARNDCFLNTYNPFVSMCWRANTDCQIIASENAIVSYISKYASKAEPQSQDLKELFTEIVRNMRNDEPAVRAFTKLLMKIVGHRDVSACEVMHLILGSPLFHCSRQFVRLFISMHDYTMFRPHENEDNESSTFSEKIIDHYKLRPVTQESTTLKEFASKYSLKGGRLVTHQAKNLRIVISVPKVEFGKCDETDEIYCKQMLLLNIPWRSFDELKTEDTWKKSYKSRQLNIWQLQINDDNGNEDDVVEREDVTEEQTEWMNLAEALPHQVPRETDLGYRDIDRNYDWFSKYDLYPNIDENINFIQRSKGNSTNQNVRPSVEDDIILNIEQEAVVQYVMLQLENNELPRFSMVTGAAGTGKSSVIKKIVYEVEKSYGEESVLLLAPTGVAANNISGQTIHSALKLGASMKGTMELRGETERDFQNSLENTKVIVIDEFSMIGLTLLGAIDTRLRQANPEGSDLTLGGYIVYFFGDFNQLQPVCDYALYAEPRPNNALAVRGKLVYKQLSKVFFLNTVMRQQGPEQFVFRELLMRMAIGEVTENDYKILSNRFDINNLEETSKFLNALRLKSTNDEIKIYNDSKLRELGKPVVIINALHNPPNQVAASASAEEANGLSPSLTLAKGCKVILRQNLWTAMGLCNGTLGEVFDIVYKRQDTESSHLDQLPLCVLVKFPTYKGPTIYDGLIPIPISKAVYKKRNITCTRQQFPLNLAFAISIHRSQGISCDKAVVDIGKTEHSQGLTYVACSRVRTIEGILFSPCFNIERFLKLNSNQEKKKM